MTRPLATLSQPRDKLGRLFNPRSCGFGFRQMHKRRKKELAQELYAKGHDVRILAAYLEVSQAKVHELIQAP